MIRSFENEHYANMGVNKLKHWNFKTLNTKMCPEKIVSLQRYKLLLCCT